MSLISDEELYAKANTWLNDPSKQNWKTDAQAISFVANIMLQQRQGKKLSERQKDYMFAILVRCYDEG